MKTNFHTHTKWCDGKNTPEEMIASAIEKGFDRLGFSSHVSLPEDSDSVITPGRELAYADFSFSLAL